MSFFRSPLNLQLKHCAVAHTSVQGPFLKTPTPGSFSTEGTQTCTPGTGLLPLKQKPPASGRQLKKAASVLVLFFAPGGRNLQQGRMRICNKRETGRSPVGSES